MKSSINPVRRIKLIALIIMLSIYVFSSLTAAPLRNIEVTLNQPNGEIIKCFASGDENYNWLHDENGFVIIQDELTGYYVYAEKVNESLVASSFLVNSINPSTIGIEPFLKDDAKLKNSIFNQTLQEKSNGAKVLSNGLEEFANLVIFIRFADENEFVSNISYYDEKFNSTTKLSSSKSVYQYFQDVSYNTIKIKSTLIKAGSGSNNLSYKATNPRSFYMKYNATTNPNGWTSDYQSTLRLKNLLSDAIQSVKSQIPNNLDLDKNNDGYVDNITFIVSGEPETWSSILWPHKWNLNNKNLYINNKKVDVYNFQLQSYFKVGILCHELFHSLGAPDLYHYEDNLRPVGPWDLMAENNNDNPQQMGAYMKYRYGKWISDIPVINKSGVYSLKPINESHNNCYRINSPYSTKEYYLIEYRRTEYEPSIPGSGLIIYRINTNRDGYGNAYNGDEVYIYRPNGTLLTDGKIKLANFSSSTDRTVFNSSSNPSPFLLNGKIDDSFVIFDIGRADSDITFKVQIGDEPVISSFEEDQLDNGLINLYPSPASHNINIVADQSINDITQVYIYNSYGQVIQKYYYNDKRELITINIDSLSVGLYYANILCFNKLVVKSFVKI